MFGPDGIVVTSLTVTIETHEILPGSMDVMFDSDSIVVTSLAVTYQTLKSGSKVHQGHHCPSNSSEILQ